MIFCSDEMNIRRARTGFLILRAADGAEIGVSASTIHRNMRLLAGTGMPRNRSARDAEIAEAAFDEAENFVGRASGWRNPDAWLPSRAASGMPES